MSEPMREPENLTTIPTVPVKSAQTTYGRVTPANDLLFQRLREGDEATFASLFDQYCPSMARLAQFYVSNPVVAEEVVQEAWLGVIRGLSRFEGRCSLKTWIFRILINIAITRGQHESRSVPFSSLVDAEGESFEPVFDASGSWISSPISWGNNRKSNSSLRRHRGVFRQRLKPYPPGNGRSSSCAISRDGLRAK